MKFWEEVQKIEEECEHYKALSMRQEAVIKNLTAENQALRRELESAQRKLTLKATLRELMEE